jgi:hypothetical protein
MAGSGAGVNQVRAVLLDNITTSTAAVANPLAAYGAVGGNDSGGCLNEAQGYKSWTLQVVPLSSTALVGFAFSVYITSSPNAYLTWEAACQGATPYQLNIPGILPNPPRQNIRLPAPVIQLGVSNATGFFPGIAPWEWVLAEAPSGQGGTGSIANPMTPAAPLMIISCTIESIRVCLTTVGTAGACRVVAKAVP